MAPRVETSRPCRARLFRILLTVGSGRFGCPPGQATRVLVEIDTTGLIPNQAYLAAITLTPEGGAPEVLPVQIMVTAPAIRVEPATVDFGRVSRGTMSTPRRSVTVTNTSRTLARCRVVGAPAWLLVQPEQFSLQPGARQSVELVGRMSKVPGRGERVTLTIALDGGRAPKVQVRLRVKGGLFG